MICLIISFRNDSVFAGIGSLYAVVGESFKNKTILLNYSLKQGKLVQPNSFALELKIIFHWHLKNWLVRLT